jgi:copper resistance protein C
MRRVAVVLAVVAGLLIPGTPALAHNQLVAATPSRDSTVAAAPTAVRLVFTERLNPDFTTVAVSDAARTRVPTGPPTIDGVTGTVPISGALGNGVYTVAYRVVSVDGHTVQGSYTFTLADPARPAAVPSAVPAAAAPPEPSSPGPLMIGLSAVVLVLIAGAGTLILRARRKTRPGGNSPAVPHD